MSICIKHIHHKYILLLCVYLLVQYLQMSKWIYLSNFISYKKLLNFSNLKLNSWILLTFIEICNLWKKSFINSHGLKINYRYFLTKNPTNHSGFFCVFISVGNAAMKYLVGFVGTSYLCKILLCKINVECAIWYLSVISPCCYLNHCLTF